MSTELKTFNIDNIISSYKSNSDIQVTHSNKEEKIVSALQVIELISKGNTDTKACNIIGLDNRVFKRLLEDYVELKKEYTIALELLHDSLAEQLVNFETWNSELAEKKILALWAKNVMWYLSKVSPQRYGDKIIIETQSSAEKVIINRLHNANKLLADRLQRAEKPKVIEADFED